MASQSGRAQREAMNVLRVVLPLTALAGSLSCPAAPDQSGVPSSPRFGLVLHGGAGVITRETLTPELESDYRRVMAEALEAGYAVLDRGGSALDGVVATIMILEDSILFNAGRGAVMTAGGICELDASIMDGQTLAAGAVAGVQRVRHPIRLARDVMDRSPHVLLTGQGAEQFAATLGYELVPNEFFHTERRRQELEQVKQAELARQKSASADVGTVPREEPLWSTVGCVALDRSGNLAAGTSTGGMTNKKWGRVGDSPIIGAGTYARNDTCAVSATGWGEFFIRLSVAHDVSARMDYGGRTLANAAAESLERVRQLGATGGLIGIDRAGAVTTTFTSAGMYRAFRLSDGAQAIEIFGPDTAGVRQPPR